MTTKLNFAQVFGSGATQTAEQLLIQKADLEKLTPANHNRPESLFVALLLKLQENYQGTLTTPSGEPVRDERNRTVNYDDTGLVKDLICQFWKREFTPRMVRDRFLIDVFVNPPEAAGEPINVNSL